MTNSQQATKLFLLGSIVLGVFLIIGLIWAIASGADPTRTSFNYDNYPAVGPANASTTVRIFGDLQCIACRDAEPAVQYAKQTYGDKVRFIWNDFPISSIHSNAMAAANAARCAEAQGKFWEYHDRLYVDQPNWEKLSSPIQQFQAYADALGLKKDEFAACISNRTYEYKIQDDLREGEQNDFQATPTFFVNNKKIVGGLERDGWDREIQASLKQN
jgi:protein-disulfide isomerase